MHIHHTCAVTMHLANLATHFQTDGNRVVYQMRPKCYLLMCMVGRMKKVWCYHKEAIMITY